MRQRKSYYVPHTTLEHPPTRPRRRPITLGDAIVAVLALAAFALATHIF